MKHPKNKKAYFTLHEGDKKLDLQIEQRQPNCFGIQAAGYGDYCANDGKGTPILVEIWEGDLRVVTWGDINQEDSTHIINMKGAKETNRDSWGNTVKKEPEVYEGAVKFTKEEQITIHEVARMGLAMVFDEIGEELDLSDEVLQDLQEKLNKEGKENGS